MRAIAILTVVLCHSSVFLQPLGALPYVGKPISICLSFMTPMALLGVELFFVLSGFLIGNILIRTFMNTHEFSFPSLRNFWVRRWLRTLPNYWLILTIDILLYRYLKLTTLDSGKLLFYPFLQNLLYPGPQFFFGESWSLSIEEWFYLTLPIVMYIGRSLFPDSDKRKFLLRVFWGYLLFFVLVRLVNAFQPISGPDIDAGIRKVVIFRLDAVMYGVLFAYFNYFRPVDMDRVKKGLLWMSIAGAAFILYLVIDPRISIYTPTDPAIHFLSAAFLYLFIPLFFSFCLPYANSVKEIRSKRVSSVVQHISKISYSMYLVHFSLVFLPFFYLHQPKSIGITVAMYVLYWVIVIGLSSLLYRFFELPVMNLRERFSRK
jgi:peptidoglycan/LPS O-acetylase OafA/YrhL